jgi:hypothetical protein
MVQLMLARSLQKLCQRPISVEGYDIPEWGLHVPRSDADCRPDLSMGSHLTRAQYVARLIDMFRPNCISIDGAIIRLGNFTSPSDYLDLFPFSESEGVETPHDRILMNIRAGDISLPSHPNYGPLPISYYQYLTDLTGLEPVFMGELEESPYFDALCRTFPNAKYIRSMGARADFQTIRRAKHIAISVSSFSWLAAYFSRAKTIHLPVVGVLDPRTRPDVDMLPSRDVRFTFHAVGTNAWTNRYSNFFTALQEFCPLPTATVDRLKIGAVARTSIRVARIHLGLGRRMIFC